MANKLRKSVKLDEETHDDFLKVCGLNDHDFMKRVRFLIKRDIREHQEQLNQLKEKRCQKPSI